MEHSRGSARRILPPTRHNGTESIGRGSLGCRRLQYIHRTQILTTHEDQPWIPLVILGLLHELGNLVAAYVGVEDGSTDLCPLGGVLSCMIESGGADV